MFLYCNAPLNGHNGYGTERNAVLLFKKSVIGSNIQIDVNIFKLTLDRVEAKMS